MVFYCNLMPARFAGYTIGPITLIRPAYRDDAGLHAHEAVHRKQFWSNPFMGLWYAFSKESRLAYEVEAYREQLKYCEDDKSALFGGFISKNYGIDITQYQAQKLLTA